MQYKQPIKYKMCSVKVFILLYFDGLEAFPPTKLLCCVVISHGDGTA